MNEIEKPKQPLPLWRRLVLTGVLGAIVLLLGIMLASYVAGKQLGEELVKIDQQGEPLTFTKLVQANAGVVSEEDNATGHYVSVLINIVPENMGNLQRFNNFYREKMKTLSTDEIPEELREAIAQNLAGSQPLFEKLDIGASLSLPYFDIGIEQGIQICQTRLIRVKTAALLMSLRTMDLIIRDNADAAASSIVSLLKLVRVFDSHPTLILSAVKTELVRLACGDIFLLLELGDPSEASLLKLQEALSEVVPNDTLLRMFYAERVYQLQIGRNYFPEKIASELLPDSAPNLPERIQLSSTFWGRFRIRRKSIKFLRDMDSLISTSRHPWPEPLDAFDNTIQSADQTIGIIPIGRNFILRYAGTLVRVRSILLAAMIERYRGSHEGQLPESLDVLVPTYSEAIPSDPFTKNNLLYKHDEEGYIVYSAFINRKDDNGSINMKTKGEIPLDLGYRIGVRLQKDETNSAFN